MLLVVVVLIGAVLYTHISEAESSRAAPGCDQQYIYPSVYGLLAKWSQLAFRLREFPRLEGDKQQGGPRKNEIK